ncbi:fatty acid hydroxylase family protein [archaeon]|nr:MAG: fatty acid hydroxylase family protein [archaeon]
MGVKHAVCAFTCACACVRVCAAFLYYCILYSPALVVPMHLYGFLAYMALMGVTGILDHCGVKFSLPGVYTTRDHDRHHEKFNVNYGFPFPWLDLAHGTFDGRFWGKEFRVKSAPA